jgi:hypothetical protein
MRTRAMNQLQAAAMNEGVRRKKTLWSKTGRRQLEALPLAPWATRRRQDLLELVDRLNTTIDELTAAAEQDQAGSANLIVEEPTRSRGLFFGRGFLWPDFGVLVARQGSTSLLLLTIGRTDLHEFRFRSDGLRDMGIDLALIAGRVGALCGIWANRKSFLLAPRRHASQSGRYHVRIRAALYGRLRQPTSDSAR